MNEILTQKELWRDRWLICINELTSIELQRKSWLDKSNENPHWTFVEFMCSYFDDLGIDNNYEYQLEEGWISKDEFETIKLWHELLNKYDSPKNYEYDVEAILEDKSWQLIVEEGHKAKSVLIKKLSEKELQILLEKIDYTEYR